MMPSYTDNDYGAPRERDTDASSITKEIQIHDPRHKYSRQEPLQRATSGPESISAAEVDSSGWSDGSSPQKPLATSIIRAPSTCLLTQSAVEQPRSVLDVSDRHSSSFSLKPVTKERLTDTPTGAIGGKDATQTQSAMPDSLVRASDTKKLIAEDRGLVRDDTNTKPIEPAIPLPSLPSHVSPGGPQISLKGYVPFDPQPWESAIADHQAKTIRNFHAIAQSLDNINAELQFIFSEFLTRQYEQIDEALKVGHNHILQQEQEQDRLQAQMVSFVNAIKHAYQILTGAQ